MQISRFIILFSKILHPSTRSHLHEDKYRYTYKLDNGVTMIGVVCLDLIHTHVI
jgi:hypothetical protein